ncbi:hypothetical protein L3Q82_015616, partial [Scortum barcoo]
TGLSEGPQRGAHVGIKSPQLPESAEPHTATLRPAGEKEPVHGPHRTSHSPVNGLHFGESDGRCPDPPGEAERARHGGRGADRAVRGSEPEGAQHERGGEYPARQVSADDATICSCQNTTKHAVTECCSMSHFHIEDTSEIQELTKYKPHVLLTQENTQIKELQQENKELWLSLEEHQYALELIMGRYRKQMLQLMMAKKELDTKPVLSLHEDHAKEVQSQVERICEMGQVMRRAVQVDDQHYCSVRERLAQLEIENKELRDLLAISKGSVKTVREETNPAAAAAQEQSPQSNE